MMQGFEPPVRVDAGPHGFGGANQNSDAPAVDVGEQPLLGARLLVVLHEGDLGAWDAELDQAGSDPAIGRKAARRLDVEGAKIGEDHLSCPGQGIGDAVRPRVAAIRRLRPDRIDIVDQRIELVARLVLIVRQNEAHVDRGVPTVSNDRQEDVVAFLGFAFALLDLLDSARRGAFGRI